MQRFMVSATRISRSPWRYGSVAGFEVLSRASEGDTGWWLDAHRIGILIENQVMPSDWLPESPVPNTLIIDDTDLATVPSSRLRSQPIVFRSPDDAMTWGRLSGLTRHWTDHYEAHDQDTYSSNSDVYAVDTATPACVIGLERVFRCAPPLPRWLLEGLLGKDCGIFRESFMPAIDIHRDGWIQGAQGPGTLWVSLDETQRLLSELKKHKKATIAILPLQKLFAETPVPDGDRALWASEAGLFARWGLMGPGRADPAMSRAFLELVRRARREPANEQVFTECFGFGFAAMEGKLESFLKEVLAQPTSVDLSASPNFPGSELQDATADQIGRILGDWMRMQGDALRARDPELSKEFFDSAGRMLERAYREDNGLPPGADPARGGESSAMRPQAANKGPVTVMKPFVVSAARIHDPRLLAVYGLYTHDTGDDAKAGELLESAARQGVVRPRAYVALAEVRYAQAMAKPLGSGGKLSARQASSILEPLQAALQGAVSPDAYRLIVETWENCDAKPSGRDIERIVEGVTLFPRYTALAYHSALVCARGGYSAQAECLIRSGILFTAREGGRKHFERLRTALAAPTGSKTGAPAEE